MALNCENCRLNFVTGANLTEGPSTWTFDDGGSFVITGTARAGNGDVIATYC